MPGPRSYQEAESKPIKPTIRAYLYASEILRAKDSSTTNTHMPRMWGCNSLNKLLPMPCFQPNMLPLPKGWSFAKVCQSRLPKHNSRPSPTQAPVTTPNVNHLTISNIQSVTMDKAPLIKVCITLVHGSSELEVLPDSGADILAARKEVLQHWNKQVSCLPPFVVIPKAVNGTKLYPLGKIPVHLQPGCYEYDDFCSYSTRRVCAFVIIIQYYHTLLLNRNYTHKNLIKPKLAN